MSTITKELAKLFRKITNSEIDAEGNAHVVLSPADSLLINNARIALASLEAEPVAWAHRLINKRNGVVHPWVYGSAEACPSEGDIFNIEVMPLYTAPPAPVAVPECFKRLLHHAYGMTMGHDWNKGTMAGHHRAKLCQAVDECRAAMLQGADGTLTNEGTMQLSGNSEQIEPVSNRDELPLDYLQGHKDGLEWAAQLAEANHPQTGDWLYDDQIDLARAIRKGPDMPTVQGGNSPVIPDEVLSAIRKVARIRTDFDHFDGDRRGIGDCLDEAEQELIVTINKYASQLAAEPIATNDVREQQTAVPPIQADVAQAIENLKQKLVECNRYNYCADAVKNVEDACRAAMLQSFGNSEQLNSPVIPDGWVVVPKKLTAENGAKGVLSGEFSETTFISCPECFGDDDCETCDGSGRIEIKVPVSWTTIKTIWAKGCEYFSIVAPQQDG